MAVDQRRAKLNWAVVTQDNHYQSESHYHLASLATLMDIRDELQKLNALLHCQNFQTMPHTLKGLRHDFAKMRKEQRG